MDTVAARNRTLLLVAFAGFATSLFVRSVDPIIPPIAGGLGVLPSTAALLSSAFALPYAFMQPALGALADMVSKTRMMMACLVVLVIAALVGGTTDSFEVLFASRMISGVAAGGVFPLGLAIAGDLAPVNERQVAISRLLAAAVSGNLLGASGAGVIGDLIGWRGVFFTTAGIGVIVLCTTFYGLRDQKFGPRADASLATIVPNYRAIFRNPLAKFCFAGALFDATCAFGLMPYVANLLHSEGEERAAVAGLVIAGFGFGGLVYTFSVSRLLPLIGERGLMLGGTALMTVGLLVVALRPPWPLEIINFLVMGLGFYCFHACIQVYASELAATARGTAMALHSFFFFLGQTVGPVLYGIGFAHAGVSITLVVAAMTIGAVATTCALNLRRRGAGP